MPLDDADRGKFEEIERSLTLDHPDIAAVFRNQDRRMRRSIAVPAAGAVAVFLGAHAVLSFVVGTPVPLLLALPPSVAAVVLLRWPDFARLAAADPDGGVPGRRAAPPPWRS